MSETAMTIIDIKLKAMAAVREICMAVEFAEQANDAIEDGVCKAGLDTELQSSGSALITARSLCDEIEELLGNLAKEATS